jgi:hypothetical protein
MDFVTRAKLAVDGSRLQSLVNGKSHGIGRFDLVPLQALYDRVKSAGGLPGRLKVSVVSWNSGARSYSLIATFLHVG